MISPFPVSATEASDRCRVLRAVAAVDVGVAVQAASGDRAQRPGAGSGTGVRQANGLPGVAVRVCVAGPGVGVARALTVRLSTEVAVEVVSGRDVSANFDMQSLASLLHGDRILVKRSEHCVRFLHPQGWNYFATLRKKLRWNEGGS